MSSVDCLFDSLSFIVSDCTLLAFLVQEPLDGGVLFAGNRRGGSRNDRALPVQHGAREKQEEVCRGGGAGIRGRSFTLFKCMGMTADPPAVG